MEALDSKRRNEARTSGRGTLRGETAFALTLLCIFATLVLELAMNAISFFAFLFRRSRHRERMRKLILTASACLVLLAPGCASRGPALEQEGRKPSEGKGSPQSFRRQMYELRWSIKTLADQSDAPRSLEEDLRSLASDPHWKANLLFDARNLFLMEDARRSLEFDLKAFADPDHRRHGLKETLEMWGW